MVDPTPIRRPINWKRLRASDAEVIIRQRAIDSAKVYVSDHAWVRIEQRNITQLDVLEILRKGFVNHDPIRNEEGDWEAVVTRQMNKSRSAGVVTIVLQDDGLIVKTVMWMD